MSITYTCKPDARFSLSRSALSKLCDKLLINLSLSGFDFDLKIVNDAEIAEINYEFLGCVGPTNVLSFPFSEKPNINENTYLGEIVLSVDTLHRETVLYGQPTDEHLVRLLAHALLHLAGYDHGEEMYSMTDNAVCSLAPEFRERILG